MTHRATMTVMCKLDFLYAGIAVSCKPDKLKHTATAVLTDAHENDNWAVVAVSH